MRRPSAEPRLLPASRWRALGAGLLAAGGLALGIGLLLDHLAGELAARGIRTGFAFLAQPAGFEIGESLLAFEATHSYARALLAGLLNTLRVALPALVLASVLGLLIGLGRLAPSRAARAVCAAYVECFRNVPLLLQLLTWYFLLGDRLPPAAEALAPLPGVFLSKSGLSVPLPQWLAADGETAWPVRGPFAIEGGATLTPEYLAVLLALSAYAAAYLAEIVRAGVRSVPRGQVEAAAALGMTAAQRLRVVVAPLALRLIVPPATNQYLNLIKNSSLAVVVGYPDLVSVANTTLNQTGQAAECLLILIAVYLALSLLTAGGLAWVNARLRPPGTGWGRA